LKAGLSPTTAAKIPLDVFVEQIVGGMVVSYRANAALLRALRKFAQARAETEFAKKVAKLEIRSFERVVDLVLAHRKDIRHPNPRLAVSFGLVMVVSTLIEVVVMPTRPREWKDLVPNDDQALKRELTRVLLSYLDVGVSE
jgi:hypothetical protein